jgi:hypothetical protein
MPMTRIDLYGKAHKGIRAALFEAAAHVARADFGLGDEAADAAEAVRSLVAVLEEHARHEDDVIMPELRGLAPEVHAELAEHHARTDGLQRQLLDQAGRLAAACTAERISLGRRLLDQVNALVAEHLHHMAAEEGAASRVLWAHRTDAELRTLLARIAASVGPARTAAWLARVLPAVNRSERVEILANVRAVVPPSAFDGLTAQARRALGPALWSAAVGASAGPHSLAAGAEDRP